MARKSTADAVRGLIRNRAAAPTPVAEAEPVAQEPERPAQKKARNAYNLPDELLERARDVSYWDRTPLADLIRAGLEREIERREKERGEAYQKRDAVLRTGRPVR